MTAFTCNSGGVENWDSKSGGSVNATLDSYTLSNGTTLLIDTDTYQCANHSTGFGSVDNVTFSGTGGKLKVDGTNVRVIPYNTGTGKVPAIGTTISQGGVSATLLGVWSGWQAEPTAAAAAMPASGYIKVKGKTGGDFAAGALTGIGASATGADVVGWIEVRGADTATITVPRLGAFEVTGDWFELGTTNGTRGQVIPCPTTATVAGVFPGVWIETASGSGVYERFSGAGSIVALSTIPTDERGKIVWQATSGIRIGSDGTNNVGFLPPTGCKVRIPNVIFTCCTRAFFTPIAADLNDVVFIDDDGVERVFPYASAGTLNFNSNLTSGGTGYYTLYYTTTPGGDDFGEGTAIIVKDKDGVDITGTITGASIAFTFDYSNNTQGGYLGSTNRDVTLVWGNPGVAKPGVSTGQITQSKGISISAVAEADPSYVA